MKPLVISHSPPWCITRILFCLPQFCTREEQMLTYNDKQKRTTTTLAAIGHQQLGRTQSTELDNLVRQIRSGNWITTK